MVVYRILQLYFSKGIDDMKNKNTIIITEEMINSDPYGYTYKEICDCVGVGAG